MVEHRRLKRQLLRYYLWVFNKEDSLLIGHVGDITTEGVIIGQIIKGDDGKKKIKLN